jgi:hypothetical protein
MRTLGRIAATLGVIGAIAVGSVVPAAAWYGYGYHHRYYGYHHRYHHRYYAHRSWWGGYLTPTRTKAASMGGFLFLRRRHDNP